MVNKNKLFVGILLALLLFNFVLAQEINLHASLDKKIYYLGDVINMGVGIENNGENEIEVIFVADFKKFNEESNIDSIEKQITILPKRSYSEQLNILPATGDYIARILIKSLEGGILEQEEIGFKVYSEPIFINAKTCEDENCESVSSNFLPNEEFTLSVDTSEDSLVSGKVITPLPQPSVTFTIKCVLRGVKKPYKSSIDKKQVKRTSMCAIHLYKRLGVQSKTGYSSAIKLHWCIKFRIFEYNRIALNSIRIEKDGFYLVQ